MRRRKGGREERSPGQPTAQLVLQGVRLAIEHSPDPLLLVDWEGQILAVNHAAENIFSSGVGHDAESSLDGKELLALTTPETRPQVAAFLAAKSVPAMVELELTLPDGRKTSLLLAVESATDGVFLAGIQRRSEGMKERRPFLDIQTRNQNLTEQLPLVIFAADLETGEFYMSPQVEKILGYTAEAWMADPLIHEQAIHPDDLDHFLKVSGDWIERHDPQSQMVCEYRVTAKDGRTLWLRDHASWVIDPQGEPTYLQGYLLDITAQKQAESDLREYADQLLEIDRLKDEFIACISHELRTPLTSIRGYLELLMENMVGELNDEQRSFLEIVRRNSERLLRLVGDLLFVAQLEAGKLWLDRERVDLAALIQETVAALLPTATKREIAVRVEVEPDLPPLQADRARVGQILDNLLSNALKFTAPGGHVSLQASCEDDLMTVQVSDTGMGIPSDELERLFERFFRSSNATEQAIQGTGLGLSITKAIVEAHGGQIEVESTEGEGTVFTVVLPVRQHERTATRTAAEE